MQRVMYTSTYAGPTYKQLVIVDVLSGARVPLSENPGWCVEVFRVFGVGLSVSILCLLLAFCYIFVLGSNACV